MLIMTASVPDGISFGDLERLAEQARPDVQLPDEDLDLSFDNLRAVAQKHITAAHEELPDPLVHKFMVLEIVAQMIRWHLTMAETQQEEGETSSAGAWMRDGGKFQAIMDILINISIGADDPSVRQ